MGGRAMTRRLGLCACLIGAALLMAVQSATGQFPRQNIPPIPLPDTEPPPLADPKTKPATDISDRARQSIIGSVPPARGVAPAPVISPDPPTPTVTIHVNAPASVGAGADVEYTITVENKSQAAAHHVKVSDPIPAGTQLVADKADPLPSEKAEAAGISWVPLGSRRVY